LGFKTTILDNNRKERPAGSVITITLVRAAFCLCAFFLIGKSEGEAKTLSGWRVHQVSAITGEQIVFFCTEGMRVENKTMKFIVVAKANAQGGTFYNKDSYYIQGPGSWSFIHRLAYLGGSPPEMKELTKGWKVEGNLKYKGFACSNHVLRNVDFAQDDQPARSQVATIMTHKFPEISKDNLQSVLNLYDLPNFGEYPIYGKYITNAKDGYQRMLDTISIERAQLDSSQLEMPHGLKKLINGFEILKPPAMDAAF